MTTVAADQPSVVGMSARRARQAVWVVLTASFVVFADTSVLTLAAPVLQRELHTGVAGIELMVASYQIGYAGTLITGGRLGDRFGRRAMFTVGFCGFVLASTACGLAATPGQLIAFRALQGVTAALLTPQVLATIQLVLPPKQRVGAFAAQGVVFSAAAITGPLLGGVLVSANIAGSSWRAIFLVNVPLSLVAIVLGRWLVPTYRSPSAKRLDLAGAALVLLTLASIMAPLTMGQLYGWPLWTWLCLAGTPLLAALFLAHQARLAAGGRDPLLPPALWHDRAFRTGLLLYVVIYAGLFSFFLYYSIVLQDAYRLAPVPAALSLVAAATGTLVIAPSSARLTRRYGARRVVVTGCLGCAVGFLSMLAPALRSRDAALAIWTVPSQLVVGLGFGLVLAPLLSLVLAGIRPANAGASVGLLATAQMIGGAIGVGSMGVLFQAPTPYAVQSGSPGQLGNGLVLAILFAGSLFLLAVVLIARLPGPTSVSNPIRHQETS